MHLIYIVIGFYVMGYGVALDDPESAHILKYDFENTGTGPYHFSFGTSDGISRQEVGNVELAGTEDQFVKIVGSFSYTGPDGVKYEVSYTADDQGFHPKGDHIMVPPFVPWIHHHHHEHRLDGDKNAVQEVSGRTGEQYLEPSGTSPKPFVEYSGVSKPTISNELIEDFNGDNHPRTPQPPLKFDLLLESAPEDDDRMQSSYPKPIAPQTSNENYAENILSTTSESPQPSLFIHSTPKVAGENPFSSSPNPEMSRTIDGNYIASGSSSTPSPDSNPAFYSTSLAAIDYSSPNPYRPTFYRISGTTPQPLSPGSMSSSTPKAQIPVGYFLPKPSIELPPSGVEENRAYTRAD